MESSIVAYLKLHREDCGYELLRLLNAHDSAVCEIVRERERAHRWWKFKQHPIRTIFDWITGRSSGDVSALKRQMSARILLPGNPRTKIDAGPYPSKFRQDARRAWRDAGFA